MWQLATPECGGAGAIKGKGKGGGKGGNDYPDVPKKKIAKKVLNQLTTAKAGSDSCVMGLQGLLVVCESPTMSNAIPKWMVEKGGHSLTQLKKILEEVGKAIQDGNHANPEELVAKVLQQGAATMTEYERPCM